MLEDQDFTEVEQLRAVKTENIFDYFTENDDLDVYNFVDMFSWEGVLETFAYLVAVKFIGKAVVKFNESMIITAIRAINI